MIIYNRLGGNKDEYSELIEYLDKTYPIPRNINLTLSYLVSHFKSNKAKITGHIIVLDDLVRIDVAAKGRFKREIALTIAHEYKHGLQFIKEDMYMTDLNEAELEKEAKDFAEDVLKNLWTEQEIYYPSTI